MSFGKLKMDQNILQVQFIQSFDKNKFKKWVVSFVPLDDRQDNYLSSIYKKNKSYVWKCINAYV